MGLGYNTSNPTHNDPLPPAPLDSTTSPKQHHQLENQVLKHTRRCLGCSGAAFHIQTAGKHPSEELTSRHPNCHLKNEKNPAMQKEKEEQPSRRNSAGVSYHGQWGENIFKLTHAYCFRGGKEVVFPQLIVLLLRAGAIDQSLRCVCRCFHAICSMCG